MENNRCARELFEKAVVLDPNYGLAHAYFGLSLMIENGHGNAPDPVKQRALDVATTAVRLDPRGKPMPDVPRAGLPFLR